MDNFFGLYHARHTVLVTLGIIARQLGVELSLDGFVDLAGKLVASHLVLLAKDRSYKG